jgi:hypothetical protein
VAGPRLTLALHTLTCQFPNCGASFDARRIDARFCMRHRNAKSHQRDLRRLAEESPEAAARAEASIASGIGTESLTSLRIAAALGTGADDALALSVAGIDSKAPGVDSAALLAEARARYSDLCLGDPGATQAVQRMAGSQAAISLLGAAASLPPAQAAAALKSAMQALELAQQGAAKVFSKVEVHITLRPVGAQ